MAGVIFMNVNIRRNLRRERVVRHRLDPLVFYTDMECKDRFRMTRMEIQQLSDILTHDLTHVTRRADPIPPILMLTLTLRYYATGDMQRTIGDSLNVSQSSASRIIDVTTKAILRRLSHKVAFPVEDRVIHRIQRGFYEKFHFPGVVGCIDGTHIRILSPSNFEDAYVNRKGYHSLNIQAIVDDKSTFINVVAR